MSGKTVVITGTTSGTGKTAALTVAGDFERHVLARRAVGPVLRPQKEEQLFEG